MKRFTIPKKKKSISFISVLAILVLTSGVMVGCGNQSAEIVTDEVISENVAEETATRVTEPTEVTEPEKITITLSADEYYVDYPLVLEDGRQVYVKIAPDLNFYPDYTGSSPSTNIQIYEEYGRLTATLSDDELLSEVSYSAEMDYETIIWMMNPPDIEWSYEIAEPENWSTGIIAYSMVQFFPSAGGTREQYILYYPLDNEYQVLINICGFVGEWGSDQLPEEQQAILDFYRTEENLFVVVDTETVDVVVSDTTDISALAEATEKSEPAEEPAPESTEPPQPTETAEPAEESAPESTEPLQPTETPEPTEESAPLSTEPPHTHSYTTTVTQPTCTTQGYTAYICNCGQSYTDNYTNGSHNYSYGTCTTCGVSDPNYNHRHIWYIENITSSEYVIEQVLVELFNCGCNIYWPSVAALHVHQDNDIAYWCKNCGYCSMEIKDENGACSYCGGTEFWDSVCTGWRNSFDWIDYYPGIENDYIVLEYDDYTLCHGYRECACGAISYEDWIDY